MTICESVNCHLWNLLLVYWLIQSNVICWEPAYMSAPALLPSWVLIKLLLWAGIMLSSNGDTKEACGMAWSWCNLQCGGRVVGGKIYIHQLERFKRKIKHQGNVDASIGLIRVHFRWEESYRKEISELSTDSERKGKSYWRTHSCLTLD